MVEAPGASIPMMNLFRRGGAGQWIVAVIATLIIVVFVVEFRTARGPAKSNVQMDCAIRLSGSCLDRKEFFAAYGLVVPSGVPAKQIKAMKLPEQVLEGLVERELLVREARRLRVGVGDEDLDRELVEGRAHVSLPTAAASMLGARLGLCAPESQIYGCSASAHTIRYIPVRRAQDGQFDAKLYERTVRNITNRGAKQFREMQEQEVVAARMRDLVRQRVRIAPEEAFLAYRRQADKAIARYVNLSKEWFSRLVVDLSPERLEKWGVEHKDEVDAAFKTDQARFVAGCPLVSELVFPFAESSTDEEKGRLRSQADAALARVKAGKDSFEMVARQSSQGETAIEGGVLGCFGESYGTGYKELSPIVAGLKDGEVSSVVESARGFHVLRLEGKLAEADVQAVGRRASVRRLAVRFLADEAEKSFADRLIDRTRAGADIEDVTRTLLAELFPTKSEGGAAALPPALVDERRPRVVRSQPFGGDGTPGEEFSPFSGIGQKLLALAPGAVFPQPVDTMGGSAVVVLASKIEATREDFEKNAEGLMQQLRDEKARDALVDYIARLRKAAGPVQIDQSLVNLKIRGGDE
jgi:peptidyl-prolyl cis-trans isomerase D